MAHIFISYASEDRPSAERIAHALAQQGFAVWWDRKIPLGSSFDQVIEENLAQADCVLVLWTAYSVRSRWVRAEASEAAGREVLIPVLLEPDLRIPLEFRLLQAANLSDWSGDAQHAEFAGLLAHIEAIGGRSTAESERRSPADESAAARAHATGISVQPPPATGRDAIARHGRTLRRLGSTAALFAVGAGILAVGIGAALWRVPTRLEVELVIDRLAFTLAGERPVDMPARPLGFRTLTVESFDRMTFTPERVRWIDRAPEAERMLRRSATVVLDAAVDETPAVVLEGAGRGTGPTGSGRLQPLAITPGSRVIVTASSDASSRIAMRVEGQPLDTNVLPAAELALTATNLAFEGSATPAQTRAAMTLAFSLPEDRPFVQLQGARRYFVITATLAAPTPLALLDGAGVSAVELLKQGPDGAVQSAVVGDGEIRYPQQPRIAPVRVEARDFVTLGAMPRTAVTRLELSPGQPGMLLTMDGVVSEATVSSGGARRDLRVSALQRLWHQSRLAVLLLGTVCLASVLAGGYRLYSNAVSA